jgi:hypothetical protein
MLFNVVKQTIKTIVFRDKNKLSERMQLNWERRHPAGKARFAALTCFKVKRFRSLRDLAGRMPALPG